MKKISILSTSLLLSVAVLALAGCAGGGGEDSSGSFEQLEVPDVVNPHLPDGDPSSEVLVPFWHCMGHARTEQVERIVEEFNAEWAGKYRVQLVSVAGSYDDLDDAVRTRLAGGEVPALTMAYPDSIAQYITSDPYESAVFCLDNYIDDEENGYTETELEDFIDAYLNEGRTYHVEGTWSMPFYKSTEVMYYNDSYFHGANPQNVAHFGTNSAFLAVYNPVVNAGANPTDAQLDALKAYVDENDGYSYDVPETWNEMVALGRQMIADRTAEGVSGEFYPMGYDSDANFAISQLFQRGIPYTTSSGNGEDHILFNNDQTLAWLTEMAALIRERVFVTGETSGVNYTNTLFTDNRTAMTIGSTGGSSYNVSSNFKVSITPVPYAGENKLYVSQGPSICFFIQNNEYVQKGAWLFYKAMAETENNTVLALESSYDPIRQSCYETTNYTNWINRHGQGIQYDIPYVTRTIRNNLFTSDIFIGSDVCRDEMDALLRYVINENRTPEAALTLAYNNCRAAVR